MDSTEADDQRPRLADWRLAAASILGFWLFYFLTIVVRTFLLEESIQTLIFRGLGCAMGVALTFCVYFVLRHAGDESIRIKIVAAAIACLPAAAIFSTFNLAFALQQPLVARTVVVDARGKEAAGRPVPDAVKQAAANLPADVRRDQVIRLIADGLVTWYFFFAAWASFYLAMSSAAQLRTAERRASRAERDAQAAQLKALRYQVNPHFLFNTLNSLSSLVMARRGDEAEEMIVNLSTFFRSSLAIDPGADIRLSEEIRFQRLYLDIEKVRFPNRLQARIDIPHTLSSAMVPPLILQPIVENAIKHGVARSPEPVTLSISAREQDGELMLTVENGAGGGAANAKSDGTGVGLANVCERLAARFGRAAACDATPLPDGGYRVTLTMPLNEDA